MRLAVLGESDDLIELAGAVTADPAHQLVACCEVGSGRERLSSLVRGDRFDLPWEALIDPLFCDGVLTCDDASPRRADQLRRLVQAGRPVMIVHPVHCGLLAVELDLIRQGTGSLLMPYHAQQHPFVGWLADLVQQGDDSPLGAAQQLVVQREMIARDRSAVLHQFADDVSLIRTIIGGIQQISAMGTLDGTEHQANLTVNLGSAGPCLARWSVAPVVDQPGATFTLLGTRSAVTLNMHGRQRHLWTLSESEHLAATHPTTASESHRTSTGADWNGAAEAMCRFAEAVEENRPDQSWLDACHDLEVAETIPDALRRGRTIQLYQEQHTESGNFKGVMSMGSCGLLLFALVATVLISLVEGLRLPIRQLAVWHAWPALLLLLLLLFLTLQLLQLLVPHRGPPRTAPPDDLKRVADARPKR